jgi:hypothetical protein
MGQNYVCVFMKSRLTSIELTVPGAPPCNASHMINEAFLLQCPIIEDPFRIAFEACVNFAN